MREKGLSSHSVEGCGFTGGLPMQLDNATNISKYPNALLLIPIFNKLSSNAEDHVLLPLLQNREMNEGL